MSTTERECQLCTFWEAEEADGGGYTGSGWCRINSPVANADGVGVWPRTLDLDWCGRFQPAEVLADAE